MVYLAADTGSAAGSAVAVVAQVLAVVVEEVELVGVDGEPDVGAVGERDGRDQPGAHDGGAGAGEDALLLVGGLGRSRTSASDAASTGATK